MESYDIVIIGSGPGGYVAAIRGAQLGKKVAIVEKQHVGGVCLNFGCIPTKALLKSAQILDYINHAKNFGIDIPKYNIDIKQMVARSRSVAAKLSNGIVSLLKKNKITVFEGHGLIARDKVVQINNANKTINIKANNVIIATGAGPRILSGFEPDNKQIWTSKEAMLLDSIPKSIIVVGSGAIGVEFASFYNSIGCNVTILEACNRILPAEDEEISTFAHKIFAQKGINIHTNVKLLSQKKHKNLLMINARLEDDKEQTFEAERLLMAVGIIANTDNIGLENTKIRLDNGHIITDQFMQTNETGIYAIGDVASSRPWLAHKASHEGIVAIEHIAGLKPHVINRNNIPACTYSNPQIASVGLTQVAAEKAGYKIRLGRFPFAANGKALAIGEDDGLIKTIFDSETGELLGAHMIGCDVTELIHGYVVAKNLESTELDLIRTIFPHPTLSEIIHESVLQAYGNAIHI